MEAVIASPSSATLVRSPDAHASAVAWPAIFAGALGAAAISIVLLLFGSGVGLTAASPWPNSGVSAGTFGRGAAVWIIVVQWLAAAFGGYLAGRLRTRWASIHGDEVFFRDTAHGFLAWAVATVIAFALLSIAAATTLAVKTGEPSVSASITEDGDVAVGPSVDAYFVDTLFRSAGSVSEERAAQSRAEGARILNRALAEGSMDADDRAYLATLVARDANVSINDAQTRIDDVLVDANADLVAERQGADDARKAAAKLSLYTMFSLLVGAFIASVAGVLGGRERDADVEKFIRG